MRGNIALALVAVFIFIVIGFAIGIAYTDSPPSYAQEKQDASYTLYYSNGKQKTATQEAENTQAQEDGSSATSVSQTVNIYTTYHTPALYYPYPKIYYFSPYPYYYYYPKYYPKPIPKYPPKPPHIPPRYPNWYGTKYYTF